MMLLHRFIFVYKLCSKGYVLIPVINKNCLIVVSVINLYFITSFILREIIELYFDVKYFSIVESSITFFDCVLFVLSLLIFIYISKIRTEPYKRVYFKRFDSKIILMVSVLLYLFMLSVFKFEASMLSYEGFHKLISTSYFGKLQYVLYACMVIQIYFVTKFDNSWIVKLLVLQLVFSVFLSEIRSFIMFQMIVLVIIPTVSKVITKNIIKCTIFSIIAMLLPLYFRSPGSDILFIVSQVFLAGAFQYDFLSLTINELNYEVSESYVSSGGGFGSFYPAYTFEYIGYLSLLIWLGAPIILKKVPISMLSLISVYYFTIIRNHPSSWGNGLIFMILMIILIRLIPKYESKNYN